MTRQDFIRNADSNINDIRQQALASGAGGTSTSGFGFVEIEGIPNGTVLRANSGKSATENGFVGDGGQNFTFDTLPSADGFPITRNTDVEYRILDNLADSLGSNTNARGAVTIVIDNPAVCASCQSVISQFTARYPNIRVNVIKRPRRRNE